MEKAPEIPVIAYHMIVKRFPPPEARMRTLSVMRTCAFKKSWRFYMTFLYLQIIASINTLI
jgi:hypothetical protein